MSDNQANDSSSSSSSFEEGVRARLQAQRRRHALEEKRSLERKQEALRAMRQEVQQLEQVFETLCTRADQHRQQLQSTASQGQATLTEHQQEDPQQPQHHHHQLPQEPKASFVDLAQQVSSLHQENTQLKNRIEQHQYSREKLQTLIQEEQRKRLPAPLYSLTSSNPFSTCFVPYTPEQCYPIIRSAYQEDVLRRPTDFHDETINKPIRLGWKGYSVQEDLKVRFQHSKVIEVDPSTCAELLWRGFNTVNHRGLVYAAPHNIEVLQKVTDDITILLRRTTMLDGAESVSLSLVYRMRVNDCFVIGYIPQPLWGSGTSAASNDPYGKCLLARNQRLVMPRRHDLFEPVAAASLGHGDQLATFTHVYRWGSCTCETAEDAAYWREELLDTAIRFENLWLRPFVEHEPQRW